jgi:2,4-dienoyl-CoA reductase-like NADH-dependent reductase (Old Yellow Enzyme family)
MRIGHDRYLDGLKRLADVVHEASGGETRLLIQLIDFLSIRRRPPPEKFFERYLTIREAHRIALVEYTEDARYLTATDAEVRAALLESGEALWTEALNTRELRDLRYGQREEVNDIHHAHISDLPQRLPELFHHAARRAQHAGFDGVELHCAHAYTLASFLSTTNHRDDGYGGDLEGRLRLPLEVYQATRSAVGDGFAVGARILVDEVIEGGTRVETSSRYAQRFAQAGMDFVSASKGGRFEDAKQPKVGQAAYPYTGQSGYECMPTIFSDESGPFGRNLKLMTHMRAAIRDHGYTTPLVVAGGIGTFKLAEATLREGLGDIIGAARASLADPDLWFKVRSGHGDQVRRCDYINYCEKLDAKHKEVTCRLWDRRELDEPDILRSIDGRRRLIAPPWRPPADLSSADLSSADLSPDDSPSQPT